MDSRSGCGIVMKSGEDLLAEGQSSFVPSDAFDRQLSENCVEYFLFLVDEETDPRKCLIQLEALRRSAIQLTQSLTKDYIWQRDDFQLELKIEQGAYCPSLLRGSPPSRAISDPIDEKAYGFSTA